MRHKRHELHIALKSNISYSEDFEWDLNPQSSYKYIHTHRLA